jgi:signal transduction histidine kinase
MHHVPFKRPLKTERAMNTGAHRDEFLTIVSHELRTPTAAILGWAELLGETALDDERFAHGIEVIKRNAQLQAQLIEHLIDFSRISKC